MRTTNVSNCVPVDGIECPPIAAGGETELIGIVTGPL